MLGFLHALLRLFHITGVALHVENEKGRLFDGVATRVALIWATSFVGLVIRASVARPEQLAPSQLL